MSSNILPSTLMTNVIISTFQLSL